MSIAQPGARPIEEAVESAAPAKPKLPSRVAAGVVGVLGLTGIVALGATAGTQSVERHLRRDVERNALANVAGVRVIVDGRMVSLVGTVNSADDRRELGDRVRARWGVADVRLDRLQVAKAVKRAKGPVAPKSVGPAPVASSGPSSPVAPKSVGPAPVASSGPSSPVATSSAARSIAPPGTATIPSTAALSSTVVIRPPEAADVGALQTQLTALRRASPIVFLRSSPTVSPSANATLDRLAAAIRSSSLVVRVEAHTDGSGDPQRNLALSEKRAGAVRDALIARGVTAQLLVAIGRGESAPIANNVTARGREINRRIEFVVEAGPSTRLG